MNDPMIDQAHRLRELMLDGRAADEAAGPVAPLVVVAGGKGGVGTTTLAVHLAIACRRTGRKVVLVDAEFGRADATAMCGLEARRTMADLLAGHVVAGELLLPGPAGIRVAPGAQAPGRHDSFSDSARHRLAMGLHSFSRHADYVIVDAGNHPNEIAHFLWQAADRIMLVTTPDDMAVIDTYAAVKLLGHLASNAAVQTIVNRAPDDDSAVEVHGRLALACQRFLGIAVGAAGRLPASDFLGGPGLPVPSGIFRADSQISEAFAQIAAAIMATDPSSDGTNVIFPGGKLEKRLKISTQPPAPIGR